MCNCKCLLYILGCGVEKKYDKYKCMNSFKSELKSIHLI
jgi:hypothetical protein